jgi:hypothetical protein
MQLLVAEDLFQQMPPWHNSRPPITRASRLLSPFMDSLGPLQRISLMRTIPRSKISWELLPTLPATIFRLLKSAPRPPTIPRTCARGFHFTSHSGSPCRFPPERPWVSASGGAPIPPRDSPNRQLKSPEVRMLHHHRIESGTNGAPKSNDWEKSSVLLPFTIPMDGHATCQCNGVRHIDSFITMSFIADELNAGN